MSTGTRILVAVVTAIFLAGLTALLLLSGHVGAAIWMEGPYFPLTLLLPGSADTLPIMVAVVATYYFVCSLAVLTYRSRRTAILVVAIVLAVNTLGAFVWRRQAVRATSAGARTAQGAQAGTAPEGHGVRATGVG